MTPPPVLTIGHRGASADAPENTLAALRVAVDAGCDLVEVDVQRTRDGVLVLAHDPDLARTAGLPRRIADLTHAELLRLDAGAWFSPAYAGERIPTLDDALDLLGPTATGLLLEVKQPALHPGIAFDVARTLRARPGYAEAAAAGRLVVQSFDHRVMRRFARLAPEIPAGLLGHPPVRRLPLLAGWAAYVNPHHRRTTRSYVAAVQAAGMRCFVWTADQDGDLRRAVDLGVDGVISNRPDALQRVLAHRLVPA